MDKNSKIKESPLFWPAKLKGSTLLVLDETLIPQKLSYIKVKTKSQAIKVIKQMKTRAFGQFLVVLNTFLLVLNTNKKASAKVLLEKIKTTAKNLNNSRPTFPFSEVTSVIIGWAEPLWGSGSSTMHNSTKRYLNKRGSNRSIWMKSRSIQEYCP